MTGVKNAVFWGLFCVFFVCWVGRIYAVDPATLMTGDMSEDQLFQDAVAPIETAKSGDIALYDTQRSLSFSGRMDAFSGYSLNRSWLEGGTGKNRLYSYAQTDLFLDIRLQHGVKAFADLGLQSFSHAMSTANAQSFFADVKELFVDFNVDKKVYVRTGKQFIKWGRGYFWNPVDFVNRNGLNFLNLGAIRSGLFGTRIHWTGGQDNAYLFLDSQDATDIDGIAVIGKKEWLFEGTEVGASVWGKYQAPVRFGLDVSTRYGDYDVVGELALSYGSDRNKVYREGASVVMRQDRDRLISSWLLGLSRQLAWERPNRISLHYEIFANGEGYDDNVLADPLRKAALLSNNLYVYNRLSSLYQGFFASVSEYPYHSTTLQVNGLHNMVDGSASLWVGLDLRVVDGLTMSGAVVGYLGSPLGEYGLDGSSFMLVGQAVLTF